MNNMKIFKIVAALVLVLAAGYLIYSIALAPGPTAEEEFNASGRAKAIEQASDLWQVYTDEATGLSLRYPGNVVIDNDGKAGDVLRLTVGTQNIDEMPDQAPLGYGKENSMANMAALAKGEYGNPYGFALAESKKVRSLAGANAQEFMVLARFEVCDVTFQRNLYFFNNNHLVVLSLLGPKEAIQKESSQYFKQDAQNCGQELIWDFGLQGDFYNALDSGQGESVAQEWFDAFEQIADTIELTQQDNVHPVRNDGSDEPVSNGVQIANPASVYCEENDGTLDLKSGMCTFPNGKSCEEWAFFRGECSK